MAKGFNLTKRAKEDLRGIWGHTYGYWNEIQADHYVRTLYDRFEWLAERPDIGKLRPDICDGYYAFPHGSHVVFYLVSDTTIDIIGVPHKSMDIESYFGAPRALDTGSSGK